MKKLILILLALTGNVHGQSQILTKLENIPTLLNTILKDYLTECSTQNYFYEDKGIVQVIAYKDSLGRDNYKLSALIDDRYLDNLTSQYLMIGGDIFLFYEGDSNGNITNKMLNNRLLKSLKNLVQDRVYIRPKKEKRWVEVVDIHGKIKKVRTIRISNFSNSIRYIFLENGTFEKLRGL
jgi:hypothetical protein